MTCSTAIMAVIGSYGHLRRVAAVSNLDGHNLENGGASLAMKEEKMMEAPVTAPTPQKELFGPPTRPNRRGKALAGRAEGIVSGLASAPPSGTGDPARSLRASILMG